MYSVFEKLLKEKGVTAYKVAKDTGVTTATLSRQKSEEETPDVPKEYSSALSKAEQYSDTLHMSKQGIYDQLVSEYGEQFSEEDAQYAIDNLEADYKANALEKAKEYQDTMDMSPEAMWRRIIKAMQAIDNAL